MGNRCYYGLWSMFVTKILFKRLNVQLCMTLIWSIIFYGSEVWILRKSEETRLAVFEREIFKIMYGICIDANTGKWKKTPQWEINELVSITEYNQINW